MIEVTLNDAAAAEPEEEVESRGSCVCGATWSGEKPCHCKACHRTFGSLSGFDDHRMGSHEPYRRRCRTEEQMRKRGYEPNTLGHWRKPRPEETLPR